METLVKRIEGPEAPGAKKELAPKVFPIGPLQWTQKEFEWAEKGISNWRK